MRELSEVEVVSVNGAGLIDDAIQLAKDVVDAAKKIFSGPSATLSNGTTIQCGSGQHLEVTGPSSAKCS